MDDERLKQSGGGAYFDESLERIRDIDFAELQVRSRRVMTMRAWIAKLDEFMRISEQKVLSHAGQVGQGEALALAEADFEKYRHVQDAKPSPLEEHFIEAIEQLKQLQEGKRPKKKT